MEFRSLGHCRRQCDVYKEGNTGDVWSNVIKITVWMGMTCLQTSLAMTTAKIKPHGLGLSLHSGVNAFGWSVDRSPRGIHGYCEADLHSIGTKHKPLSMSNMHSYH